MLMRNPEYPIDDAHEISCDVEERLTASTSREMLRGQIALFVLFAVAILLRGMA